MSSLYPKAHSSCHFPMVLCAACLCMGAQNVAPGTLSKYCSIVPALFGCFFGIPSLHALVFTATSFEY